MRRLSGLLGIPWRWVVAAEVATDTDPDTDTNTRTPLSHQPTRLETMHAIG